MIRKSHVVISHRTYRQFPLAKKLAKPFSKPQIAPAIRTLAPTLIALTFAGVAHAQGTMDFSRAQTLMGTFKHSLCLRFSITRSSGCADLY
jgi:hypothetical protein